MSEQHLFATWANVHQVLSPRGPFSYKRQLLSLARLPFLNYNNWNLGQRKACENLRSLFELSRRLLPSLLAGKKGKASSAQHDIFELNPVLSESEPSGFSDVRHDGFYVGHTCGYPIHFNEQQHHQPGLIISWL